MFNRLLATHSTWIYLKLTILYSHQRENVRFDILWLPFGNDTQSYGHINANHIQNTDIQMTQLIRYCVSKFSKWYTQTRNYSNTTGGRNGRRSVDIQVCVCGFENEWVNVILVELTQSKRKYSAYLILLNSISCRLSLEWKTTQSFNANEVNVMTNSKVCHWKC